MNKKPPLIILTGPTASGKTALSVELAKKINAEIISADSIQVYKHMDIGSAKVKSDEMQGVPHHMIDVLNPDEEFNVFKFKKMAEECICDIYSRGKMPMIVGGTGFYIQSVLYNVDFSENDNSHAYRKELEEFVKKNGPEQLHKMLCDKDKKSAEIIHPNNVKRVIRALEYYNETGKPISEHNNIQREKSSPYNFVYFVLCDERAKLYERINARVDRMIDDGLEDEVRRLLNAGYSKNLVSMQGIGYKEMIFYIEGEMNFDETKELIKKNTRNFAKRQLTWFRREKNVTWIDISENGYDNKIMSIKLLEYCKKKGLTDYGFI